MAFDQNSVPQDLRPLNVAPTMPEETPIVPFMTSGRNIEGFYVNPPRDVVNPGAIPVCYPPTMSDAGFVSAACGSMAPGAAGLCLRMPTAVAADAAAPGVNSTTGHCLNPNLGKRSGGNASDQASDEGGEDSVSGKKIKFLCSFWGKIIPRPSDGMLRYVGGQTRIVSVRRDVSFNEIVQKMVDMCGQNVVIKYQLPDEDLDALVSVSCPDDLENMMDECQKLVESSLDGSAKLRVFLFSPSELESSGMLHLGGLQESGQRYFEAVNGILDGVGGSIARKESFASMASTQNSDFSGTEPIDSSCHGQGDVTGAPSTGMLSPRANSATSQEPASRSVHIDPSLAIYPEASTAPLGIPVVLSGPQIVSSQLEHELERPAPVTLQQQQVGVELQEPGVNLQPPAPYLQAYVDPRQEMLNHADYLQVPSQMGFPTQLLGTVGPVFTHPQFHENASSVSSHHFVPTVHMTMTPKPNAVMPLAQPHQTQLGCHPDEGTFGARIVQVPGDQSYNTYQTQVPPTVVGGGYGRHQVQQPEQVVFSEGWIAHQQVMFSEKIPRFKDCYMCENDLPHSHSDVMVQDQRESPTNNVSDPNSVCHSLQLEDKMRAPPMNRVVISGAQGGDIIKQGAGSQQRILGQIDHEAGKPQSEAAGTSQNLERWYENDRIILQKKDNPDHPKSSCPQGVGGLAADVQSTYGVVVGNLPQRCQENAVQQIAMPTQYQVKQENLINKPLNSVVHPDGSISFQKPDKRDRESPKDYSVKLPSISPKETVEPNDHLRQIDGWMENLRICHPGVLVSNEQSKSPIDNARNEDVLENQQQKISGKESYLESTFGKPATLLDSNHVKPNEMIASSNDGFFLHNFRPMESYEVAQPSLFGNPTSYQQSNLGINHLAPVDNSYGKPAFSCVDSAHVTDRIPPFGEWPDNNSQFQPMALSSGDDIVASNWNTPPSLSPSNRVLGIQDTSNSLFSNQDPLNLRQDAHFPPPRPSKIAIRKEGFGMRAPIGGNHFGNSGELTAEGRLEDRVYQPAGNMGMDFGSEHSQTTQGSAEELIKQELQAVAEGIAASVLQSSMSSTPDITMHERDETLSEANQDIKVQNTDVGIHSAKFEDIKTKLPEKINVGFPVSDGIGRLQIIKSSDLEELQELGSGTFGTVFHGKWRGTDVAIKRINDRCFAGKPSEQERMREDFWNEAINLADLHHPNVVAFYGVVLDGTGGSVATVTEYMVNGSLRTALQKNERNLDKRKRLFIAMDVAFGMEYLHGKNIVHFDLKSDNLLVNLCDPHRPICKVGDLGLSKVKCQTLISGGVRGTLPWMAPELLNGSSSLVSEKVDVFSFGIVMWELLTGEEPYADLHYGAIIGGIVSNTLRPLVPESCDPAWRSLMERCWSSEPSERPSFTNIANELRTMAAKVPLKAQTQQQPVPSSAQPQVRI